MCLRVKGWAVLLVAKDHVRVEVGIEVGDAVLLHIVLEGGLALSAGVIGAFTSRVVGTIAVDVEIVVVAGLALEEDGIRQVSTVDGTAREGGGELLGAGARLNRRCQQ